MNHSRKHVWLARLLALVVMSLGTSFLATYTQSKTGPFTHDIRIKVNGNVDQIVSAIEAFDRSDVRLDVHPIPWYMRSSAMVTYTIGMIVSMGIFLGFYHVIYRLILGLIDRRRDDDYLIEGV